VANHLRDRTGQRFGRLVAISRATNGANGSVRWLCRCDCGNTATVATTGLAAGTTRSCGCLRTENAHRGIAIINATHASEVRRG
jgi:hypothetical protein